MGSSNGATQRTDVVIVGGGIAGGSLATALAHDGLEVLVLERDRTYRDRNKGENMMPWGWAEASMLGIDELLRAAKGVPNENWVVTRPDGTSTAIPVHSLRPDAPGTFSIGHVTARRALAEAATLAGADLRFGVSNVTVAPAPTPTVTWTQDGHEEEVRARLVVGADGRGSRIRRQFGLELERGPRTHVIASVLVDGVHLPDSDVRVDFSSGRLMLTIPQPERLARVYLVSRDERFTGAGDVERMLSTCQETAAHDPARFAHATPVGACATYGGEDTWVDDPRLDGQGLLIGDAAGHNSPIIGQGLSLALRDVRLVADLLTANPRWDRETLEPYVTERRERLRRVRFAAQLWAELRLRPAEELIDPAEHPDLQALLLGIFAGFDDTPRDWFTDDRRRRLLALASPDRLATAGTGSGAPTAHR